MPVVSVWSLTNFLFPWKAVPLFAKDDSLQIFNSVFPSAYFFKDAVVVQCQQRRHKSNTQAEHNLAHRAARKKPTGGNKHSTITKADISVQPDEILDRTLFWHSWVFKCVPGRFTSNDLFLMNLVIHKRIKLFRRKTGTDSLWCRNLYTSNFKIAGSPNR